MSEEMEQVPSEAFQDAYGEQEAPEQQEEAQAEPQEVEQTEPQGPTADDLNDPNSEYWKGQAKSQGWSEDFSPDPSKGKYQKTAREFVNDGDLYGQLHSLKQNQDRMQSEFKASTEQQLAMQRAAHVARLEELSAARNAAMDDFDREKLDEVDKQMAGIRDQMARTPAPAAPTPIGQNPVVQQYEANNPWVNDMNDPTAPNFAKAQYADKVFVAAINQGASPENAIAAMDQAVRSKFPAQNAMRQTAPAVESASRPSGGGKPRSLGYDQLSRPEQRQIDMAVNNGMYTREEAVKKINQYRQEG